MILVIRDGLRERVLKKRPYEGPTLVLEEGGREYVLKLREPPTGFLEPPRLSLVERAEKARMVTALLYERSLEDGLIEGPHILTPGGFALADQALASGVFPTSLEITRDITAIVMHYDMRGPITTLRDLLIHQVEWAKRNYCLEAMKAYDCPSCSYEGDLEKDYDGDWVCPRCSKVYERRKSYISPINLSYEL